jgi:hypothetical protein
MRVIERILSKFRWLGPYLAIELLLPGGSIVALLLWTYRNRLAARQAMTRIASQWLDSPQAARTPTAALQPANADFETTHAFVSERRDIAAANVGGFAPAIAASNIVGFAPAIAAANVGGFAPVIAAANVGEFAPVAGHGHAIWWQGARDEDRETFQAVQASPAPRVGSACCAR